MTEAYIPNARDATVGLFGRNSSGLLRAHCVTCNDRDPLQAEIQRIYGDLYVQDTGRENSPHGIDRMNSDGRCDLCKVTFLSLSERCQAEHDDQQARWARLPVTHVVEMGMIGAVRCRIY